MMLIKDLLNTIKKDRDYIDIEIYVEEGNHSEPIKSFLLSWLDLEDKDLYLSENLANTTVKEIQVIQLIDRDEDFYGEWVYENGNILFKITIKE